MAEGYGNPRAFPPYREGRATNSGREMAQLLGALAATLGLTAHNVPPQPTGRLC